MSSLSSRTRRSFPVLSCFSSLPSCVFWSVFIRGFTVAQFFTFSPVRHTPFPVTSVWTLAYSAVALVVRVGRAVALVFRVGRAVALVFRVGRAVALVFRVGRAVALVVRVGRP